MRPRYRGLQAAALSSFLAFALSCSSGSDGGTPPNTPGTISISLSSSNGSVQGEGSVTSNITVTRSGGQQGVVTLTAAAVPAGVVASFSPASLAAEATTSTITFTVSASAAAASYPIIVRASSPGMTESTATYTLQITAPPVPDFGVSVTPASVSVQQAQSGTATINISRTNGFTGSVGLVVSGAPTDVTVGATPTNTTGNTATVNIAVGLGVAPGTYPLVVTATENGPRVRTAQFSLVVTPVPSAGTLTLSPSTVSVTQGQQSAPITVNIGRGAGITGDAQLTLENLPPFVTGTFTPNPATGATSTLVLNVGINHPPGTVTFQVRATIGASSATANLTLNTTPFTPADFAIAVDPAATSLTAGGVGTAAVAITRTGSYAGDVSFAVTGAPAGVTASIAPSPTSGNAATLTISTNTGTLPGLYPLVVSATGPNITGTRTANFALTVNAPGGGGNIQWRFCAAERIPLWFGVRSGTSGAWTHVPQGANSTYAFAFDNPGQIAYVQQSSTGFEVVVFNTTPQIASQRAADECNTAGVGNKTVNGSVTNVLAGRFSAITLGGAMSLTPDPLNTFTLSSVRDGPQDLVAMMGYFDAGQFTDFNRLVIRRNINPASGSTLPVIDFTGPESFPAASSNGFFDNFGSDPFIVSMSLRTANGVAGTYQISLPSTESPRTLGGIPSAARAASDLHMMMASTTNATTPRQIFRYSREVSPGIVSFGPLLNPTTVTVLGSSPVRLRASASWQSEYGSSAGVTFAQSVAAPNSRAVTITGDRGFFGDNDSYTFEVPDFTGAPGWNPDWMLRSGVQTTHMVSAIGTNMGIIPTPTDGLVMITGQRVGTITP